MKSGRRTGKVLGALTLALAFAGVAGGASAAEAVGLGSRWPQAPDVSRAASFHAYRWESRGVEYIQVNGLNGSPLMAIATAGGNVLVLPIGQGNVAVLASAPQFPAQLGQVVYVNDHVEVTQADGGFYVRTLEVAPCSDPVECSKPQATTTTRALPVTTMSAQETCNDPVECSKP